MKDIYMKMNTPYRQQHSTNRYIYYFIGKVKGQIVYAMFEDDPEKSFLGDFPIEKWNELFGGLTIIDRPQQEIDLSVIRHKTIKALFTDWLTIDTD